MKMTPFQMKDSINRQDSETFSLKDLVIHLGVSERTVRTRLSELKIKPCDLILGDKYPPVYIYHKDDVLTIVEYYTAKIQLKLRQTSA